MIPRLIHHVWVGPRPVPGDWARAWADMHPGWGHRVWREADLDRIGMPSRAAYEAFLRAGDWAGASDIARVAVLLAEGGVYTDIDSRPLRSLEGAPFMDATFFAAYEPVPSLPGRIANGTIGATPMHDILQTYAALVEGMSDLSEPWDTCGGTGLTAAVLVHRRCCRPEVLPSGALFARDHRGRPVDGGRGAYVDHLWATTNRLYPTRNVILVPRRPDGGRRDALWAYARTRWEALGWPVVEGRHDGPGKFNISAARNEAARLAGDWDVAAVVDADTVSPEPGRLASAAEAAHRTGRLVRLAETYLMCDEAASDELMATGRLPARGVRRLGGRNLHAGGVHVVPRRLWDQVGGYDERFVGWGHEDTAFEAACEALAGPIASAGGTVHHLWHPVSPDRDPADPDLRRNAELAHRYASARTRGAVRALLAERDGRPPDPPSVAAVVVGNGRREAVSRAIASLEERVSPIGERLICDDSGDPVHAAWLRESFPAWTVRAHRHMGFAGAVRFALAEAARLDSEWVFWAEEDFAYERPVDLARAAALMDAEGEDLKQVSLKRQSWFPEETAAGPTVIDRFDPALFAERGGPAGPWLEHRVYWTCNPHLARRSLIGAIAPKWPEGPGSEHRMSVRLLSDRRVRMGILGARSDPPWARHFGERTGTGY